ncbi:hypothetical protein H4R18_001780 [Coemansia javaensis]|uniref:EF-hand domain-containing protein n=1 Tax=Coemansia javaensis TaxID=2761396 RepID=A0A9W8HBN3_9FUNG|nr:hypothetical protein H4R18_001780 [Coemansia javaensis]
MPAKLLDDDMDFTPECERALREVFARYDKDGDGALNEEELQAFAVFTNGSRFTESDLADIRAHLKCTPAGALCSDGFVELYHVQTAGGEDDETWRDLKKHGYNDDLQLAEDCAAGANDAGH